MKRKGLFLCLALSLPTASGLYLYLGRPGEPDRSELDLYFHAVRAYEEGDLSRTVTLTETLCRGNPRFFQARLLLAKALFFRDEYPEAEAHLRRLLKDQGSCAEAHIWLLRTLVQEGKIEEAGEYGETLLTLSPQDPRVLGLMAGIAYTGGDIQKTLEYYHRAILFEEELAIHRIELAKIYVRLFNTEAAVLHLEKASELLADDSPLRPGVVQLLDRCRDEWSEEKTTE